MYQKEIIYLHLFDGEIRGSCLGYLKTEKKEDRYTLELQVKNLPQEMTGSFPIRLQSAAGWREADMLPIKERSGKWTGISGEQILRAEIIVSRAKKIKGESKSIKETSENEAGKITAEEGAGKTSAEKRVEKASIEKRTGKAPVEEKAGKASVEEGAGKAPVEERAGKTSIEEGAGKASVEGRSGKVSVEEAGKWSAEDKKEKTGRERDDRAETTKESNGRTEAVRNKAAQQEPVLQIRGLADGGRTVMAAERPYASRPAVRGERAGKTEHTPLYENKWEQLLSTYEQIHPYGDNRIYVKLQPKDFIILRENYQHLVNNSFLLHGFYNYRYLILGKENGFYLGVPGVFYEREKMVALMFGFEAFECEGGEAEEGKFGYYLRKVEL